MALPTTYNGRGAFAEIAAFMNATNRRYNNFRVFGDGYATVTNQGVTLYLGGMGYPWGDTWPFGVSMDDATVTIHNIACQVGDTAPQTKVDSDVTITSDGDYVYFRCPWTGGAITLGVTQDTDDFLVTATYYSDFIVKCGFDGTRAWADEWGCAGSRQKHPGNFGQI